MNKVLLVGYVAANPIVNTYGGEGKKIARFSVAVRNQYSKNKENNSTFIPCVA
jgi:single-stranded DNA-binding protein